MARQDLVDLPDFTLETAHSLFTSSPSQRLAHADLLDGLHRLGVSCDSRDCHLLVARYDADMDGRLGYWEFANMFMPIDQRQRHELEARRMQGLSDECKAKIRGMLMRVLDTENHLEHLRQSVRSYIQVPLR